MRKIQTVLSLGLVSCYWIVCLCSSSAAQTITPSAAANYLGLPDAPAQFDDGSGEEMVQVLDFERITSDPRFTERCSIPIEDPMSTRLLIMCESSINAGMVDVTIKYRHIGQWIVPENCNLIWEHTICSNGFGRRTGVVGGISIGF